MYALWQDMRYGLRMLGKNPGFTTVAVITLAVGIGANGAIFSVVDAVLLKPLPFSEPDRLVAVSGRDLRNGEKGRALSYPDFADLRAQTQTLESVAAFDQGNFTLTGDGEPQQIQGGVVSADLLTVLRAAPMIGRSFVSAHISGSGIRAQSGSVCGLHHSGAARGARGSDGRAAL